MHFGGKLFTKTKKESAEKVPFVGDIGAIAARYPTWTERGSGSYDAGGDEQKTIQLTVPPYSQPDRKDKPQQQAI